MIGTLVWKEYREHRSVWVALAVLTTLLLVGLYQLLDIGRVLPPGSEKEEILAWLAALMAAAYGAVCGAMMLAGERESRTMAFLDSLTGRRTLLWRTKLGVGLALTLGQSLLIAGIDYFLGGSFFWRGLWSQGLFCFLTIASVGVLAFAVGMFFSAVSWNVLSAAALTLLSLFFPLEWLIGLMTVLTGTGIAGFVAFQGIVAAAALWSSWRLWCRDDLYRQSSPGRDLARVPFSDNLKALLWLSWRQGWMVVLSLWIVGPLLSLFFSFPGQPPFVTAMVGVICGTAAFAPEQSGGCQRFLGDQRLPLGRVWAGKTAFWFSVAALVVIIAAVESFWVSYVAWQSAPAQSVSIDPQWPSAVAQSPIGPRVRWLLLEGAGLEFVAFLFYGFSIGQLITLAVRKTAVALVLSFLVTAVILAVWVPSLIMGGVSLWQLLLPPALLLAACRMAMWSWASGRLWARKSGVALAACAGAAAVWTGAYFCYRTVEVPDVGPPFDVAQFEAGLLTPEQNQAGRLIGQAAYELDAQLRDGSIPRAGYSQLFFKISQETVPGLVPEDEELLDRLFQGQWVTHLREAALLPLGMVEQPQYMTLSGPRPITDWLGAVGALLLRAHAQQLQARGDAGAALEDLVVALALSRQLRHEAAWPTYYEGNLAEERTLAALDHWQRHLGPRPDLLRRALSEMTHHENQLPPLSDLVRVEYVRFRNSLDRPSGGLMGDFSPQGRRVEWMDMALQTSWEKQRMDHILKAIFAGWLRSAETPYWELEHPPRPQSLEEEEHGTSGTLILGEWLAPPTGPGASLTPDRLGRLIDTSWLLRAYLPPWGSIRSMDSQSRLRVQTARVQLARALYQAEEGKPAQTIEDLVPRYLPEFPVSPVDGSRISLDKGGP